MKKKLTLVVAFVLVFALGVAGTFAYLTAETNAVVNTFTVGNVDIGLAETTSDFKMVPGQTIAKDPKVTVKAGSEACWLFVKIDESSNLDNFIDYSVITGTSESPEWIALTGNNGVYYRAVPANATDDQVFSVIGYAGTNGTITENSVLVKSTVTKAMMDALGKDGATQPTLTFTAYAIQQAGFDDNPAAAWTALQTQLNPTT